MELWKKTFSFLQMCLRRLHTVRTFFRSREGLAWANILSSKPCFWVSSPPCRILCLINCWSFFKSEFWIFGKYGIWFWYILGLFWYNYEMDIWVRLFVFGCFLWIHFDIYILSLIVAAVPATPPSSRLRSPMTSRSSATSRTTMSGFREGLQGATQWWRTENITYHWDKNPKINDFVKIFPVKAQ